MQDLHVKLYVQALSCEHSLKLMQIKVHELLLVMHLQSIELKLQMLSYAVPAAKLSPPALLPSTLCEADILADKYSCADDGSSDCLWCASCVAGNGLGGWYDQK